MHFTTPVARELCCDSPHTFGHPTPPDIHPDSSFTFPSTPPPLPPLDHPELAAVLSSRSKSTATKQPSLSALSDRPNTRILSGIDDFVSPSSSTFGRSIRHHSSFPRAQLNFNTSMDAQHQGPPRRARARSISERARRPRRTSADWSAYQAIAGVNAASNQAWPAEVSREILRLSLGAELDESWHTGASGPRRISGSSTQDKTRPRGGSMYDLPDRANTISPSFLPFPLPSRQSYPPPLKEPMTLLGAILL
ncbi:hypothetical protein F5I97DRAFT_1810952 [Phlebopus sp. FC_14]|nr:hypothetical protein F5I97DRAFT_1810952 [Phlebopus sp. FC_14]